MARVFLDTNFYFDITKRAKEKLEPLQGNLLFISPLSTHILFYTFKLKVPHKELDEVQHQLGLVPFTEQITEKSLQGPTSDFEDNVQLHSAAEADCDFFLTSDQKLLKMKFFGKVRIVQSL
jgi:predicted nucleic acid-binding protein